MSSWDALVIPFQCSGERFLLSFKIGNDPRRVVVTRRKPLREGTALSVAVFLEFRQPEAYCTPRLLQKV